MQRFAALGPPPPPPPQQQRSWEESRDVTSQDRDNEYEGFIYDNEGSIGENESDTQVLSTQVCLAM
jgi:hypothetical protein